MTLINIYPVKSEKTIFRIEPGIVKRDWMNQGRGNPYNCLPLKIANQYGWTVYCPEYFEAYWNGKNDPSDITIAIKDEKLKESYSNSKTMLPYKPFARSDFGFGILTIALDFIFKTDENISIYVKGVSNYQKENIFPLEGIIETDWLPFTFTMNYKFHKPGRIEFYKDEPLFMFFPIERSFIESFSLNYSNIEENQDLKNKFEKYNNARKNFILNIRNNTETTFNPQRFYAKGITVDEKEDIPNHKVRINLKSNNEKANAQ